MTRKFMLVAVLTVVLSMLVVPMGYAQEPAGDHPLKGQTIEMSIVGIGGWVPSALGVEMSPLFADYPKENYGYDVTFTFQEAPFSALFQKAAASLATKSQEYNLIISDSQWLGAFAEPGWIVSVSDLIKENPELDIEWYDPVVVNSYMTYPDGSDQLWGLPQEGDVIVLYVRQDLFSDPDEMNAFKEKYGWDLPQTFEDWEAVTMTQFEDIAEFFTRPEDNIWGTTLEYQKEYDFMTMYLYPFMFSLGGEIWNPETSEIYGVLNSDVNARALEWNREMLKYQPPGVLNYGISEATDAFTQSKLATAFMWATMGAAMIPEEFAGKVLVVPPPQFEREDGTMSRIYSIGGRPWVVNAFNDEAHMTVAVDFLKWWYQPDTQLEYAKRGGNPTDKAAMTAPGFEDIDPWNRAYKYMLTTEHARDFWHDPKYSELLAAQQEGWTAFAAGQVNDAKNTNEWIACEQQKILFEAGRSEVAPPDSCKSVQLNK